LPGPTTETGEGDVSDEDRVDIHTRTAARLYGVPESQVTPAQRAEAKRRNFGALYGMKAATLLTPDDFRPSRKRRLRLRFEQAKLDTGKFILRLGRRLRWWPIHDMTWADGTVFMTRYTLFKTDGWTYAWKKLFGRGFHAFSFPAFSLKVHRFRKDDETAHDHPWNFCSLIVWRSYVEEQYIVHNGVCMLDAKVKRRWLSFDRHHPDHVHRVIVEEGKDCWTLCLTWGRLREWGFWEEPDPVGRLRRWVHNREHGEETGRHRVTY
jgi:hypothetical protein